MRKSNVGALALYEELGFRAVGVRKGYYAETNEDALVMWSRQIDSEEYATRLAGLADGVDGETVFEPARRW